MAIKKTMIELFSGSGIMAETFKKAGYKVFTIDFNKELKADLNINILDFDINMLPDDFKSPDVIWASPPCQTFSIAAIQYYWDPGKKPKNYKTYIGLAIVKKTVEIIQELKPKYWFIENPVGMLRFQPFMLKHIRKTINFCQYGSDYMKPTDIWTNRGDWITKKRCIKNDNCHISSPRGSGLGLSALKSAYDRGKLPQGLCDDIVLFCENKAKVIQKTLNNRKAL